VNMTDTDMCRACNPKCPDDCAECEKAYLEYIKEEEGYYEGE